MKRARARLGGVERARTSSTSRSECSASSSNALVSALRRFTGSVAPARGASGGVMSPARDAISSRLGRRERGESQGLRGATGNATGDARATRAWVRARRRTSASARANSATELAWTVSSSRGRECVAARRPNGMRRRRALPQKARARSRTRLSFHFVNAAFRSARFASFRATNCKQLRLIAHTRWFPLSLASREPHSIGL